MVENFTTGMAADFCLILKKKKKAIALQKEKRDSNLSRGGFLKIRVKRQTHLWVLDSEKKRRGSMSWRVKKKHQTVCAHEVLKHLGQKRRRRG